MALWHPPFPCGGTNPGHTVTVDPPHTGPYSTSLRSVLQENPDFWSNDAMGVGIGDIWQTPSLELYPHPTPK